MKWDNETVQRSRQDSLDSSCACVLSGILGISLKEYKKKVKECESEDGEGPGRIIELMLIALL